MKPIESVIYAPFLKEHVTMNANFNSNFTFEYHRSNSWERNGATVSKIRITDGYPIKSFRKLVEEVAIVTINNRNFEMFYRGQTDDYKDSQGSYYENKPKRTIIYPSICRPEKKNDGSYKASIRKNQIKKRYDDIKKIINEFSSINSYQEELHLALFQHYEVIPTPFIDITQSLRVAATFALKESEKGYLYVFGLPFPNGSISYFIDLEIVLIKLQNICPPEAYRPRYQEGYLVGKYPIRPTKEGGDNLARRLVAKFLLDNSGQNFWDENFTPMPNEILFPTDDNFAIKMKTIKEKHLNNSR